MEVVLAILTGLFAGLSGCLAFAYWQQGKILARTDAERKRWVNKVLVRDGQAKVFPDSEIETKRETEKDETRTTPIVMRSPFQNGIQILKDKINSDKKTENGSNLPDEIKFKISEAAQARQAG